MGGVRGSSKGRINTKAGKGGLFYLLIHKSVISQVQKEPHLWLSSVQQKHQDACRRKGKADTGKLPEMNPTRKVCTWVLLSPFSLKGGESSRMY